MRFIISFTLFLSFLLFAPTSFAAQNQFITIVNPVRGQDFFQLKDQKPSENVNKQWAEISRRNLSATWLIRPDALRSSEVIEITKSFTPNQELGIFMEVTPYWAELAHVAYKQNPNWHDAGTVFLTGYEVSDRKKLIDKAFEKFKDIYGYYPKSVGAWWIDAGSLLYMRDKYGIVANLDVADQYTTDNYQIWGQYWSTPFYPSKRNALVPAVGQDQKIGIVTLQWATRDPYNSYGNGVLESTYSVQVNDYANKKYHQLTTDYFKKLLSIYLDSPFAAVKQVTVGLENDFVWEDFGEEYKNQLDEIKSQKAFGVKVLTMSDFSSDYQKLFPLSTPEQIIFAEDPLGSGGKVIWYQTPRYRVGWFFNSQGSSIRDLRLYYNNQVEPCIDKSCNQLNLAMTETRNIDEVTYGERWMIDEGQVSNIKLTKIADGLKISYLNQAGLERTIQLLANDIKIDNSSYTLSSVVAQVAYSSQVSKKISQDFEYKLRNGLVSNLLTQLKNLIIFVIFLAFAFYLPGLTLLRFSNLDNNTKFILSIPVGLTLFTISTFILGYLNIGQLIILLPIISLFIVRKDLAMPKISLDKANMCAFLVILLGSLSWLLTMVKNGLSYDFGLGFWGPHGHDAIWHLSLIENLKEGLPPQNPVYSGDILQNYHYFYDLLLSATSNWTHISSLDLYFRQYPIFLSLMIGFIAYFLANKWFSSRFTALLSVFFVYFGGSFGWFLTYLNDKTFGGESTFWAQQGISTLLNPPLAISFLILTSGLILYLHSKNGKQTLFSLPLILLWGSLIEFKAYSGVLVLGSLAVVSFVELLKKNLSILKLSVPTFLVAISVFLPNNLESSSLLLFSPFWLIHSMVDFPDRLNFARLTNARLAGFEQGNWFKFIGAETIGLLLFIVGNLGTRIIGLWNLFKLGWFSQFNLFILSFLALSLLFALLFIQKGANFNTIQFIYYFIFIFNFLAASVLSYFINKGKILGLVITSVIILMTLPTTLGALNHYLPARPPARISHAELLGLQFLRSQPQGVVLGPLFDKNLKHHFTEPLPIFSYESTAYISAISGQKEFIADTVNLDILGIDYKGRVQTQKDILAFREPEIVKKLLSKYNITYIYLPKFFDINLDFSRFDLVTIFENKELRILKYQPKKF